MNHQHIILSVVTLLLIPFLVLFAAYVQLMGESSAGGGFQAGVILATIVIVMAQVFGLERIQNRIPIRWTLISACLGILIYAFTGVASFFTHVNYLNYSTLSHIPQKGQAIGIMIVEMGVGLCVFGVMVLIYYCFAGRK